MEEYLFYNPDTGIVRWKAAPKFHPEVLGKEAGAAGSSRSGKRYHVIKFGGRAFKRSRIAFYLMTGRMPTACIDHINGNSLDDRWVNLREATIAENCRNIKATTKRSGLPLGIRLEASGKFRARIRVGGRSITVGTFDELADAVSAYAKAREVYYGEFA